MNATGIGRILALLIASLALLSCGRSDRDGSTVILNLADIAAPGSAEPHLAASGDGTPVLSWLEPAGDGVALRLSRLVGSGWEPPRTVAHGSDWFVNWADFPSVVPIDDALWAAHWLVKKPGGTYAYDVAIALSEDGGETWSQAITPHTDGTHTEHGFVSLFPWQDGVGALWLDGRNMIEDGAGHGTSSRHDGMTLRSAVLSAAGEIDDAQLVDELVCDCCQTDVAIGPLGPIAVYRNRTEDETRDIYVARAVGGRWLPGIAVADDGWEIAGCPVNGPAVAADGDDVAVAWFTAADNRARVRIARSRDGAESFDAPVDVDTDGAIGRVGVLLLPGGDALASWLHRGVEGQAEIRARRVTSNGTAGLAVVIATTSAGRMSGFPQMLKFRDKILFAWTDVADDGTTVRSALVEQSAFRSD